MTSDSNIPRNYLTLQEAGLWRIYKPSDAYDPAYLHACEWFATHHRPKRHLSIRLWIAGEFGSWSPLSNSGGFSLTKLWICVIELSPGFHVAFPVWRGDAFFRICTFKLTAVADVSSDHEIAELLGECSCRGGFGDGATPHIGRRD
jgi:hypothetical protein